MSNAYRVPDDGTMGHWSFYSGDGVPPEPYLRKEIRPAEIGEAVPLYGGDGSPVDSKFIYPDGAMKVVWVLVGTANNFPFRELISYGANGRPEIVL